MAVLRDDLFQQGTQQERRSRPPAQDVRVVKRAVHSKATTSFCVHGRPMTTSTMQPRLPAMQASMCVQALTCGSLASHTIRLQHLPAAIHMTARLTAMAASPHARALNLSMAGVVALTRTHLISPEWARDATKEQPGGRSASRVEASSVQMTAHQSVMPGNHGELLGLCAARQLAQS
jgi:hypothetical protein